MSAATNSPRQWIEAVREFNRFYTQKIGVLGDSLLGSGYSLTEVRVLYELAHREAALAAELVRDLTLDAGYLSRMLAKFQKRGLLKRQRAANDARKSYLRLTPKGRKVFESLDLRAQEDASQLLAPLPRDEQAKLQGHLQNVRALLSDSRAQPRELTLREHTLTLREHRPGDIGWIVHKHGLLYSQEYGWSAQFEALVAEICVKFIRNFDPGGERCWIAERNGTPVGCVMLVRQSPTVARLRLLLVESSARGLGVGAQLVDECIAFARQCGYRRIVLWTQSILTAARHIYASRGFNLLKSEPNDEFGADLISETWELKL